MTNCINCGNEISTPFCGQCGQKNPPKKINLLSLYTDFQTRIYGFDGMFPRTLRDLTIAPGKVARAFIDGNRVRYVGPVGYFFLTLTLFLLIAQLLEIDFFELSSSGSPFASGDMSARQAKVSHAMTDFIFRNMRIFSFLQIPITAFFAWLFFRKERINFLETSVLVFYVSGHLAWISILNLFLFLAFSWNLNMWQILVNTMFIAFAATTFYTVGSKMRIFIKAVMVSIISFLIYFVFFMVLGVVYIMTNPELVKMLKEK